MLPISARPGLFTRFAEIGILAALLLLVVFFSAASPYFLSFANFVNIGLQTTLLLVGALAMTFIIICGEIDLSIGAVASLVGVLVALCFRNLGLPFLLVVVVGLLAGVLSGFVIGFITVYGDVPSFLVTLGMLSVARGINFALTDARAISVFDDYFLYYLAEWAPLGVGISVWITSALFVILLILLTRTAFGQSVYASGGNARAAWLSGVNVASTKLSVFVLAGALTGLAGILLTARLGTGFVEGAKNLELDAIAAVVLGGTSLSGGRGSLWRTVLGALFIGVLGNGMTLMNIDSYLQLFIKGVIIIVAVGLDRWRTGRDA